MHASRYDIDRFGVERVQYIGYMTSRSFLRGYKKSQPPHSRFVSSQLSVPSSHTGSTCTPPQVQVGASLAQVRSSYRRLAMALHPDKCKLDGAAAAFQRLHTAYTRTTKALET